MIKKYNTFSSHVDYEESTAQEFEKEQERLLSILEEKLYVDF